MDRVIFDTNAYRYLVKGKSFSNIDKLIKKLKASEKKNGIETLISPIVAKELLAHVADKKDSSYNICLNAIKALYLHSSTDENGYKMLASPELLISNAFFGKTIPAKEETNRAIGQMLYHIATNPSDKVFKRLQRNLQANKEHVLDSENDFAIQMQKFVSAIDPDAQGWRIFPNDEKKRKKTLTYIRSENCSYEIALGFVFVAYGFLLSSGELSILPNEELREKANSLMSIFPEPIALQKQVFENLVNSEFNLLEGSKTNFVWDIQLMFNVGNHQVENSRLYFVTDDKAMIRSALKENAKYTILNFDEYIEYLK